MTEPPPHPDDSLWQGFEQLCGKAIQALQPIYRGGNNRLFQLRTEDGVFAAKVYPVPDRDPRNRLAAEFEALDFLYEQGVGTTPRPFRRDDSNGLGLYEWIAGSPITRVTANEIKAAVGFLRLLKSLSALPQAQQRIGDAAEACLTADDLQEQIERRINRLGDAAENDGGLGGFLETKLIPTYRDALGKARQGYDAHGWQTDRSLRREYQTLSPSDFGFHNALRRADGEIVFLDFEYFGWDDPVRLVSDFVLHPGMALGSGDRQSYLTGALPIYDADPDFRRRLKLLFPLVMVRWCLILLNEFLPDFWKRRTLAGLPGDQDAAKSRQLAKATDLLSSFDQRMEEVLRAI